MFENLINEAEKQASETAIKELSTQQLEDIVFDSMEMVRSFPRPVDYDIRKVLFELAIESLALVERLDQKSSEEFHRSRRMFFLFNSRWFIADPGDIRSHKEWMTALGVGGLYNEVIRGYLDNEGLYLYSGRNFELPSVEVNIVRANISSLIDLLNIPDQIRIHGGVIPGAIGTKWKPKLFLGCVKDFRDT